MTGWSVVGVQEDLYCTGHGDGYRGPRTVSSLPLAERVVAGMALRQGPWCHTVCCWL